MITNSDDSILDYSSFEADECTTTSPYMNTCCCESFFIIDLKKSNNDIEEEILEENIIDRNVCVYDLNDTHLIKVGDTLMNIENMVEPGIVVPFERERNNS